MTEETSGEVICPRCGQQTLGVDDCAHCGIVFAKFHQREPRSAPRTVQVAGSGGREPGQRRLGTLFVLLVVTLVGAMAFNSARDRQASAELESTGLAERPTPASSRPASPRKEAPRSAAPPAFSEPLADAAELNWPETTLPNGPAALAGPAAESNLPRAVPSSYSWYQGAAGFHQGFEEAERENKAVLVYFYTDWCPYCRQLDRDILSRGQVEDTTKLFVKIKINPEQGSAERELQTRYGVTGYPSLFVHAAGSSRPIKVRSRTKKRGEWRSSSPAEFVEMLTRTVGERFTVG